MKSVTPRVRARARAIRLGALLLVLASPVAARGEAPLSVVALGPEESAPVTAPPRPPPGLTPPSPRGQTAQWPPAVLVLVDGQARILLDPTSGASLAARARPVDLGSLEAVLLTSTRPRSTAELPLILGEPGGPGGTVRLIGPAAGGPWPATSRWAGALFGPSGVYAALRGPPRSVRLVTTDVPVGAERRVGLQAGVNVRAVTRSSPDGPVSAFRIERGAASVVLLGAAPAQPLAPLTALARGTDLLVAWLSPGDRGRGLVSIASEARPGALWIVSGSGGDPQARQALERVAPTVVWASRGEQAVTGPGEARSDAGGCRTDAECGAGRVCVGCGEQDVRTCVAGCRSRADCPAGQACVQVECIRCPCPAQCMAP